MGKTNLPNKNWEMELDRIVPIYAGAGKTIEELKSFINSLLSRQREELTHDHEILVNTIVETEKQKREELAGKIEGMKKKLPEQKDFIFTDGLPHYAMTQAYNSALSDVIKLIKEI